MVRSICGVFLTGQCCISVAVDISVFEPVVDENHIGG